MTEKYYEEMECTKALKAAMTERRMKQSDLADKMGMQQCSISGNLHRPRMGIDVFLRMMDAMDYDIVVMDRKSGNIEWKVISKSE